MLGLFGIFGRSQEIQRLDRAFRAAGLHPRIVADAVKIATAKQLKQARSGASDEVAEAAELIAYCALGPQEFALNNGAERTEAVEQRMERAIEAGQGLDARLILLTLHAKLTHPSVIDRYDLAAD
ncbi:MAG: hypothetical protein EXR00_07460 [Alphaproteobacteria bacterium]|nr:hypothetical protein [Alphaproteobacteria bacterium]